MLSERGLVIGKFMPFHRGHKHLLDTAVEKCKRLTIVVCSLPTEPIPGKLRHEWIREAYPAANVVQITDPAIPQEPKDHPDFWNIWRQALRTLHPEPIDVLFSSEEYGYQLSEELNATHYCVDIARHTVPISGTMLRARPYGCWNYLTEPAKSFFNKRVLITGPESCGKSTMTECLAKHFDTVYAPEFAREYLVDIGYGFSIQDLNNICVGQNELIEQIKIYANKIGFSDTSAIETNIYAKWYLDRSSGLIEETLIGLREKFDLTLLLTPDVQWVPDGQRNLSEQDTRWRVFDLFESQVKKCGLKYEVISGDSYEQRLEEAIRLSKILIQE